MNRKVTNTLFPDCLTTTGRDHKESHPCFSNIQLQLGAQWSSNLFKSIPFRLFQFCRNIVWLLWLSWTVRRVHNAFIHSVWSHIECFLATCVGLEIWSCSCAFQHSTNSRKFSRSFWEREELFYLACFVCCKDIWVWTWAGWLPVRLKLCSAADGKNRDGIPGKLNGLATFHFDRGSLFGVGADMKPGN